jgi:hypothetical protein
MATNQTSNQLTADTILNGMQNIYTDFLNFSGHEFEQATSLLKDTKESLGTQIRLQNNQNLNLETLGEIQTELFSSLERVLSTDLVTKVQSYIDDFKSKMLEQTEFNTISSIEQFKNISKELSSLGSHMTQDVHINADFPNVTDSYEIQTAIQNLVNSASQHISKSTR